MRDCRRRTFGIGWPALVACLLFVPGAGPARGGEQSQWECITTDLWKTIPQWEDGKNHFVRRTGSLLVNPITGELFLLASPRYGVWHSNDRGETWRRSDPNVVSGRTWGGDGAQFDPADPNRMMFFTIVGAGATPVAGMTLDGGETWQAIHRPAGMRHDGWTSGQVDWSDPQPKVIYAKQHHTENLWLTTDCGETWKQAGPEGGSYKVGMIGSDVLLAAAKTKEPPIQRSTDGGKTWQQVHGPVFLMERNPQVWGDRAYWAVPNALLVTRDRGKSWQSLGPIAPDVPEGETVRTWGPVFGRSEREMLTAVRDHGYFRTTDGGRTWRKIAPWADGMTENDVPREAFSMGWVPSQRLVYCGFLGGESYRYRYAQPADSE